MEPHEVRAFIDSKFRLPVVEGEDKVCPLDEAIRTHVKKSISVEGTCPFCRDWFRRLTSQL